MTKNIAELYPILAKGFIREGTSDWELFAGMCDEAEEALEEWRLEVKYEIENNEYKTKRRQDKIADELGDVLWFVYAIAHERGLDMNQIMIDNINKLEARLLSGREPNIKLKSNIKTGDRKDSSSQSDQEAL